MILPVKYLSMFIWFFGAAALYGVYATNDLPHVIWNYTFYDNGDRYNVFAERYYTSCQFIGPYGVFTVDAKSGKCGWVRLFKKTS